MRCLEGGTDRRWSGTSAASGGAGARAPGAGTAPFPNEWGARSALTLRRSGSSAPPFEDDLRPRA